MAEWLTRTLIFLLMIIFIGGLILAIADEGLRYFRAHHNTKGTVVDGFALYEKELPLPGSLEKMAEKWPLPKTNHGWQFVDFYRHKLACEFMRSRKQSRWEDERKAELKTLAGREPMWQADQPPLIRYRCAPSPMLYRAGQGWGIF